VAEAAVVGVPHPHSGEAVTAYVVPVAGAELDEEELVAWCARHLARYKCPAKISFVDQLPHSLTGKILRRSLR
jgi:long-chain acyl-CoA synthetase